MKIGIVGAGQLGLMLLPSLKKLGAQVHMMDQAGTPAQDRCDHFVQGGGTDDARATLELGKGVETLTIEIEKVSVPALRELQSKGVRVIPSPDTIATIQDRLLQKQFLNDHAIPTSEYCELKGTPPEDFLPGVQKVRTGGYDGKGTLMVNTANQELLTGPSILEKRVPIEKEIAVQVARSQGKTVTFEPVEMGFDPELNLLDYLACPANLSEELKTEARGIAIRIAEALDLEGLLAVEMFLTQDGSLLVNELAPRPHNSGHHTMEASTHSQFDVLAAILLGKAPPTPEVIGPSVMMNVLGEPGHEGAPLVEGLEKLKQEEGVSFHSYNKSQTRPGRKMGHFTVLRNSVGDAIKKAKEVKQWLKIKSLPS